MYDDALDEDDPEHFTVTLSNPANAELAGGGATVSATGEIEDDDPKPRLSIADATLTEGAGDAMQFAVRLDPPSGRTVAVRYATADATAVAGADYTPVSGTLNFPAGTTRRTAAVPVANDLLDVEEEHFTVTLSNPSGAGLADATATGTITDDDGTPEGPDDGPDGGSSPLELDSLQVTGAASAMYPPFAADTYHYALACYHATTLRVTARAKRSGAQLTLLRADPNDHHQSTGNLDVQVTVNQHHDVAIELSDNGDSTTYVVHCVPRDFPRINILTTSERVTDGLLLMNPSASDSAVDDFMAVLDNNGVPRFHRPRSGRNLRRHPDGRYSITRGAKPVELYDERFDLIKRVTVVPPLTVPDGHDFLITDEGNYLFISYQAATRNLCEVEGHCGPEETTRIKPVLDSVIQEVTPSRESVFLWNTWDHVKLEDCRIGATAYAHLNSLYLKDGDIVASFRHCNQVLRIDRSSGHRRGSVAARRHRPTPRPRHRLPGDCRRYRWSERVLRPAPGHADRLRHRGAVRQWHGLPRAEAGRGTIFARGGIRHFVRHASGIPTPVPGAGRPGLYLLDRRCHGAGRKRPLVDHLGLLAQQHGRRRPQARGERGRSRHRYRPVRTEHGRTTLDRPGPHLPRIP